MHTIVLQRCSICCLELGVVRKTAGQEDLKQTINWGIFGVSFQLFHGWHIQKVTLWLTCTKVPSSAKNNLNVCTQKKLK